MLYAGPGWARMGVTSTSEVFSLSDDEDATRSLMETSCYIPDYPYRGWGIVGFSFRGILTNCGEYAYFEDIELYIALKLFFSVLYT